MKPATGLVLVVDDDAFNRDLLSRRLKRAGHQVVEAHDGDEALAMLGGTRFDMVLLDEMMPGTSGSEVLAALRKIYTPLELPVIMTTAKGETEDIVAALAMGANDYVTKPINFPILFARMQTHLRMKTLSSLESELLGMATHDLKNPLLNITLVTEMLQASWSPADSLDDETRKWVQMIRRQAERMRRIVDMFLELSRWETGGIELVLAQTDLNTIASRAVEDNSEYARKKGIELRFEPVDGALPLIADSSILSQLLDNLLGNALKFSQTGAAVTLRAFRDGSDVVCEVIDQGPGIPDDEQDQLFLKHAKLSNKPTGGEKSTGLGLYVCKKMIDVHSGRIGARNNPDRGATFWFRVPVSARFCDQFDV